MKNKKTFVDEIKDQKIFTDEMADSMTLEEQAKFLESVLNRIGCTFTGCYSAEGYFEDVMIVDNTLFVNTSLCSG